MFPLFDIFYMVGFAVERLALDILPKFLFELLSTHLSVFNVKYWETLPLQFRCGYAIFIVACYLIMRILLHIVFITPIFRNASRYINR